MLVDSISKLKLNRKRHWYETLQNVHKVAGDLTQVLHKEINSQAAITNLNKRSSPYKYKSDINSCKLHKLLHSAALSQVT